MKSHDDVIPKRNLPVEAEAWGRTIEETLREIIRTTARLESDASNLNAVVNTGLSGVATQSADLSAILKDLEEALGVLNLELEAARGEVAAVEESLAPGGEVFEGIQTTLAEIVNVDIGNLQTSIQDALAEINGRVDGVDASLAELQDVATTADGRYTVASENPTTADGSGKPENAVWEVRSGGIALRRFVWTGTSWEQIKTGQGFIGDKSIGTAQIGDAVIGTAQIADAAVTNAKIGDLDAGKITTGYLDADRIDARSITAEKLILGTAENLIPNGAGEFGGLGGWTPTDGLTSWDPTDAPPGLPGCFVREAGSGAVESPMQAVPVEPGAEYYYELWVKADRPGSKLFIMANNQDGGIAADVYGIDYEVRDVYLVPGYDVPTTWLKIAGFAVMSPTTNAVKIGQISYNHPTGTEQSAEVRIAGFRLQKRASAELIVDGAVTAQKIRAGSVTADAIAANAVTADAIAANAVSAPKIEAGAVTAVKLAAGAVTTEKLAAGAVTANEIQAGAVTSAKLAAGAVSAGMLDVGQNMRFTSNGIEIFAPAVGTQQWDDWENRDRIIHLTPAGDISISVASDGQATAGMLPEGTVWGNTGDFNQLKVGGADIFQHINTRPAGTSAIAALTNHLLIGNNETRILYAPVELYPDHTYLVTVHLVARSTANWKVYLRQSDRGAPTTGNSIRVHAINSPGSDSGYGYGVYVFNYILHPEWTPGEYTEDGLYKTVGVFVSSDSSTDNVQVYGKYGTGVPRSFIRVEDIGSNIVVDWQAPSSNPNDSTPTAPPPPPPKKSYSKAFGYRGWWQGWTANGRTGTETRPTVGGMIYGADMYQTIMAGINNMTTTLSGSTVKSAKVTVRRASSGGYSNATWNIGFVNAQGKPSKQPVITNIATNQSFGFGQARTFSVPSKHLDKLRTGAFSAIAVTPAQPGSQASYGYLDPAASRIEVIYEK